MAIKDATIRNTVWLGKRPKAVPVLVPYVILKSPSAGQDSPNTRVFLIISLEIWSRNRTVGTVDKSSQSLYQLRLNSGARGAVLSAIISDIRCGYTREVLKIA